MAEPLRMIQTPTAATEQLWAAIPVDIQIESPQGTSSLSDTLATYGQTIGSLLERVGALEDASGGGNT